MGKAVPMIIFFLLLFVPLASTGTGELLLENDRFVIRYTAGDDGLTTEAGLPLLSAVVGYLLGKNFKDVNFGPENTRDRED